MRLSVCMIVRDEERQIVDCLESLKGLADEVIVVDTGSSDNTPELARAWGAKVFEFKWINDFAAARNESLKHATGDYILWLDADDRIPLEERERFSKWKETLPPEKDKAFWFIIESPERGEDFFSRYATQIRAFPNLPGVRFIRRIHESVLESLMALGLKFEETDLRIKHIGYSDPLSVEKKAKRNLKMLLGALAEAPWDFVVYWHLSQTYGALREHEQALRYAKEFLEKGDFTGQHHWKIAALLNVGRCYERLGDREASQRYYQEAEAEDPENPMVLFTYARFLMERGDLEGARKRFEALKAVNPKPTPVPFPHKVAHYYCCLWLGDIYLLEGKEEEALREYEEAFRLNPDGASREFYSKAGELALKRGKEGLALEFLQRAKRLGPNPAALSNLGVALRRMGDLKGAEEAFKEALALDPFCFEALANLGHMLLIEGRHGEAKGFFERALSLSPYALDLRLGLCLIGALVGEIEELLSHFAWVLRVLGLELEGELGDLRELSEMFEKLGEKLVEQGKAYEAFLAKRTGHVLKAFDEALSLGRS